MCVGCCACCCTPAVNENPYICGRFPIKGTALFFAVLCLIGEIAVGIIFIDIDILVAGIVPLTVAVLVHIILFLGIRQRVPFIVSLYGVYVFIFSFALCCVIAWFIYIEIDPSSAPWYHGNEYDYGNVFQAGNEKIDQEQEVRSETGIFIGAFTLILVVHFLARRVIFQLAAYFRSPHLQGDVTCAPQPQGQPNVQVISVPTTIYQHPPPPPSLNYPAQPVPQAQPAQYPLPHPSTLPVSDTSFDPAALYPGPSTSPYQPLSPLEPPPPYPGVERAEASDSKKKEPKW